MSEMASTRNAKKMGKNFLHVAGKIQRVHSATQIFARSQSDVSNSSVDDGFQESLTEHRN
jgi:hypothetical protein